MPQRINEMKESTNIISYHQPIDRRNDPGPALAMLLCLPGMICWSIFLGIVFRLFPRGPASPLYHYPQLRGRLLLLCWAAAVVTGLLSLAIYFRRPKPWYVCLNLAINVMGLFFTFVFVALIT